MSVSVHILEALPWLIDDWLKDNAYICLETESVISKVDVQTEYAKHHAKEGYSLNDYKKDHGYFTRWEFNHWHGNDGWDWNVYQLDAYNALLVLAVED
jgi:hypothetical protein